MSYWVKKAYRCRVESTASMGPTASVQARQTDAAVE